jgi:protein-tyrosine-phosphatase
MKVLFVCLGNAHRSPLAEALLKKLRPGLEVDSAGIHPGIPISEEVRKYLAKENAVQYLKEAPEALESKQLEEYDLIVVMEPRYKDVILRKCPDCNGKIVVWNIEDPYSLPLEYGEKIYQQIKERVIELANSLQT